MKILIVMDPGILIPPKGYGGHERLVEMFAKEYLRQGHEVHLLVTKGSVVPGCIVHEIGKEGFPPKKGDARKAIITAWQFLWKNKNEFDLVHNFGRLIYLLPILNHSIQKIMTYGREISKRNIKWINKLPQKNIVFTGCSNDLVSRGNVAGKWETVYNAIDFKKYNLVRDIPVDAPLIFLGRIERVKGCHTAIEVAKATGNKLIIAGNISPLEDEKLYFEKEIQPHIDGINITYVGALDDVQKNTYLGKAKALLFPIEWNEPFGMVMVEAMACGTPVIGYKKGSVPEVVKNGVSGFIVAEKNEMMQAIINIGVINREQCYYHSLQFDVPVIAQRYLSLLN